MHGQRHHQQVNNQSATTDLHITVHSQPVRGPASPPVSWCPLPLVRCGQADTVIYVARGTVFDGEIRTQGLGLDAT
jgi:hypothetical protein